MKPFELIALPDELISWQGTAAQLADKLNEVLPAAGLEDDVGSANERLVRYYVSEGVLSEPDKSGRERLFGLLQVVEFLIARRYLADGWPLAKVRDLVRSDANIQKMLKGLPRAGEPTQAQRALERLRGKGPTTAVRGTSTVRDSPAYMALTPDATLQRAASLTARKTHLQRSLRALGNPDGSPGRERLLSISLAPWCQVLIDPKELAASGPDAPQVLGEALTHALELERVHSGEKK